MGVAGDPDIYFCYKGRHVEVELKAPGEQPTPLQWARLRGWEAAGAEVAVMWSIEDLERLLARLEASYGPMPVVRSPGRRRPRVGRGA
jgi:hypothetical protein